MSRETPSPRLGGERFFSPDIQPTELSAHLRSASGLGRTSVVGSQRRRNAFLPLWFHFRFVTTPIESETSKPGGCPLEEWQRMVLLETRGLWLSWIIRGGIECPGRLARLSTRIGLTASVDTSPRIRASQNRWPRSGNDSQEGPDLRPETLKLLVVSDSWRRNSPPFSKRSKQSRQSFWPR